MHHTTRTRRGVVAVLAAAAVGFVAAPAAAHGGSVAPPTEPRDCRNLALYDKGEAGNAEGGTATAGKADSAVEWDHCP